MPFNGSSSALAGRQSYVPPATWESLCVDRQAHIEPQARIAKLGGTGRGRANRAVELLNMVSGRTVRLFE
jgi:hypothetical protein